MAKTKTNYVITDRDNHFLTCDRHGKYIVVTDLKKVRANTQIKCFNVLKTLPKSCRGYIWQVVSLEELRENPFVGELKDYLFGLKRYLSHYDCQVNDIYHVIEINNPSKKELYKLIRLLQSALKQRRIIKQNIYYCECLLQKYNNQISEAECLRKIRKYTQQGMVYRPRVLSQELSEMGIC